MKILIPARKGSKGVKFKNRTLLEYTLATIPVELQKETYVSTDDEVIKKTIENTNFNTHDRSLSSASDTASIKQLVEEFCSDVVSEDIDEIVVMLYLTYPQRTYSDIKRAIEFFNENSSKSLLCRQPLKSNPFLCMYEEDGYKGSQIIPHNLYRRQDYPKCFEISHFVSIFKKSEVKNLNNNMYNKNTIFLEVPRVLDIDTELDMRQFKK